MAVQLIRRYQIFMHQDENTQPPHRATLCRPLRR
jgi:hypothetical protein